MEQRSCACANCGKPIYFQPERVGRWQECPSCGLLTLLFSTETETLNAQRSTPTIDLSNSAKFALVWLRDLFRRQRTIFAASVLMMIVGLAWNLRVRAQQAYAARMHLRAEVAAIKAGATFGINKMNFHENRLKLGTALEINKRFLRQTTIASFNLLLREMGACEHIWDRMITSQRLDPRSFFEDRVAMTLLTDNFDAFLEVDSIRQANEAKETARRYRQEARQKPNYYNQQGLEISDDVYLKEVWDKKFYKPEFSSEHFIQEGLGKIGRHCDDLLSKLP